jgi:hypothetical protein
MKNMEKGIIVFGAVIIALLMISSATAVPQVNSKLAMENIKKTDAKRFVNYFTSDKFANYMKSDNLQNFLSNKKFNDFYNSKLASCLRDSKLFARFVNTDAAQQYLDNLNDDEVNERATNQKSTEEFNLFSGLLIGWLTWSRYGGAPTEPIFGGDDRPQPMCILWALLCIVLLEIIFILGAIF